MKKALFYLFIILSVGLNAQTTNKDVIVNKVAPLIHANGTGAVLKLYNTTITESSGKLTVSDKIASPNVINGYTTTTCVSGTTTLTAASTYFQYFTGTLNQIVVLPVTSTLALGHEYFIINNSTGSLTINTSGSNTILTIAAGTQIKCTCILTSGTGITSWSYYYYATSLSSGKKLTVSNSLTLAGTDATTITFPGTSATLARIDAANTFTGIQTITNANLGYTTTATNGGTLTLTSASTYYQFLTGSAAHTIALPVTSTLSLGHEFYVVNNSTGLVTVNSSGSNAVIVMAGNSVARITCILSSGTTAASWNPISNSNISTLTLTGNNALTLSGNATVWNDLMFPSHSLKSVGTAAKPDYDVVGQTLDFPEDTTEAIGFAVQMPHDWLEGSTIWPHVHWLRESADSVDWTFRYKWFNIGTALPSTWTQKKLSHNTQTWTTGTIHELSRVVDAVGISGSGKTLSSMLVIKFYRNSDPYSGDAKLLELDIHYERDGLGSRTESAK